MSKETPYLGREVGVASALVVLEGWVGGWVKGGGKSQDEQRRAEQIGRIASVYVFSAIIVQ